jgi:hypothetical protein
MSIKDWGSYATVNPFGTHPSWVFGQEFPWNAIECRFVANSDPTTQGTPPNPNQLPMIISNSMIANLFDGKVLYPPSELSICGVNFVMKASWRIYVDYTGSTEISLTSDINYFSASHQLAGKPKSVTVFMDQVPTTLSVSSNEMLPPSITLDLNIMALDPLGVNSDAAIVGFIPNKFIPPLPATAAVPQRFKTISAPNDLMIEDTTTYPAGGVSGFTVSETCLTANWSNARNFPYQITLYFKIIDSVEDYTLYIKHWITQSTGVTLSIVVNGHGGNTITKSVDALEAEGGENNLLSIALRDLDFASINYHDYLQLGLNSVQITMQPEDDAWSNCGYQIRAVSIVKG